MLAIAAGRGLPAKQSPSEPEGWRIEMTHPRLLVLAGTTLVTMNLLTAMVRSQTATPPQAAATQAVPPIKRMPETPKLTGNVKAGQELYEKVCASCHRIGEIGKDVGPDLTTLASRFRRADVIDSIVNPSKTISDQYEMILIETENGDIYSGMVVLETATRLQLRTRDAPEKPLTIPVASIKERRKATSSMMPEGLLDAFTEQQVEDLLAFVLVRR
jgi:putative heme-binding domain-containing protein